MRAIEFLRSKRSPKFFFLRMIPLCVWRWFWNDLSHLGTILGLVAALVFSIKAPVQDPEMRSRMIAFGTLSFIWLWLIGHWADWYLQRLLGELVARFFLRLWLVITAIPVVLFIIVVQILISIFGEETVLGDKISSQY